MSFLRAALLSVAAALVLAPASAAHGIIERDGGVLRYSAPDPGIGAQLTLSSPRRGVTRFADPRAPGGIDWGPCLPVTQRKADCPTRGVSRIEIEVFDGDDDVFVRVATPITVIGGPGDDWIVGGYRRNVLDGGDGDDTLIAGPGGGSVIGGSGSDFIEIRNGSPDPFSCGGGIDTVLADPADPPPPLLECENVGVASPAPDTKEPRAKVQARSLKLKRRKLTVPVSMTEPGRIVLTGKIRAGKRVIGKLGKAKAKPNAPGQRWSLRPSVSRKLAGRMKKRLAASMKLEAVLFIEARDRAGNKRRQRARLRLRG